MNGKIKIPIKAWKAEYNKLIAERKTINQKYLSLKDEVKKAEQIRKSIYNLIRQEQREQTQNRKQSFGTLKKQGGEIGNLHRPELVFSC